MKPTPKQEAFTQLFIQFGDASKAYRQAYDCSGMKPATVHREAKRLIDNPKVATRIREIQEEHSKRLNVSAENTLREYARIGFSDIRRLFNDDGSFVPIHDLDEDTAAAIASFDVMIKQGPDGEELRAVRVKLWPKNKALESLAKNLGLFEEHNWQRRNHVDIRLATDEELQTRLNELLAQASP